LSTSPIPEYLKQIEKAHAAGNATEHTYRPALKTLVESLVKDVSATNEPKRERCGAPDVWNFHIGGYQVCQKWLKDRKGRQLTYDDITHYQQVVAALGETIRLMAEINTVIDAHGDWPLK
jgi:hypothetical protein